MTSTAHRPTLSVSETAEPHGISRWLVEQAVRDGSLASVRVGRRILIPRTRLLVWLEDNGFGDGVGAPSRFSTPQAALTWS